MKKPHTQTLAYLDELQKDTSFIYNIFGATVDRKIDALSGLAELGDLWVIPSIFHLAFASNTRIAKKAARTIQAIIQAHPRRRLLELDHLMRQVSMGYSSYTAHYPNLKDKMPSKVEHLARLGEFAGTLLGIASFDASGHVREAAIKALGKHEDATGIPYLLIRLGDWVKPVRDAAEEILQPMIHINNAHVLIESLDLAGQLAKRQRIGARALESIKAILGRPEAQAILFDQLNNPFSPIRRECVRMLLESNATNPLTVLDQIEGRPEIIEELLIAAETFRRSPPHEAARIYERFDRSTHGAVRLHALEYLLRAQPETAQNALWRAIFDNMAIRSYARAKLQQHGVTAEEIAAAYRKRLTGSSGPELARSISGLAEMGNVQDCERIASFLGHQQVSVVKAAIHGLSRLAPEPFFPIFLEQLQSETIGASKQAKEEILRNRSLVDFDPLWTLFMDSAVPHVRRHLFDIFNTAGKWDRLWLMLQVAQYGREEEKVSAREALWDWLHKCNRSFTQPSEIQRQKIRHTFETYKTNADSNLIARLSFILHS